MSDLVKRLNDLAYKMDIEAHDGAEEVSKAAELPTAAISAVVIVVAIGALFFIRWKKSV